jgi:DUF4097 and DUF4098 domain-containing protein YvlB
VAFNCPLHIGNCSLNATLQVPARTAVSLSTGGGDVTVPVFTTSRLTLRTEGGNLTAGRLAGGLDLETGGGDVTASALDGQVDANTQGGNLNIESITASKASITSGGGDVTLVFAQAPDNLQVNSDGGNVTLVLPRNRYNVNSDADGGVITGVGAVGDYSSAAKSITVDSGGGDITFRQAG